MFKAIKEYFEILLMCDFAWLRIDSIFTFLEIPVIDLTLGSYCYGIRAARWDNKKKVWFVFNPKKYIFQPIDNRNPKPMSSEMKEMEKMFRVIEAAGFRRS